MCDPDKCFTFPFAFEEIELAGKGKALIVVEGLNRVDLTGICHVVMTNLRLLRSSRVPTSLG